MGEINPGRAHLGKHHEDAGAISQALFFYIQK
jgi:hypothetical protein